MNTTRWPLIAIGCVAALIGACLLSAERCCWARR